jgi:hypothetical protein
MTTQQNTILIQFFVYFVSKKMSFLFAKGFSDVEANRIKDVHGGKRGVGRGHLMYPFDTL